MIYPQKKDPMNTFKALFYEDDIQTRIASGIEKNRKSDAVVHVCDSDGAPMPGVEIRVRQTASPFHFGANIFKLGDYDTDTLNRRYEEAFLDLFNGATVPFYWKTLEPTPGKPRFSADSPYIPRRPPPDVVVDFCRKHGLRMHGHTLVWDLLLLATPEWLPRDEAELENLIDKRVHEIAERYGDVIKRWDVVNEVKAGKQAVELHPMPEDYVWKTFEMARRHFPQGTRFDINEASGYWRSGSPDYADFIEELLRRGSPVGGVGMQFHLFTDEALLQMIRGEFNRPQRLFDTLDLHGRFGLPIHVSEITMPSLDNGEEGLAAQADLAEMLYQLWFSHPGVEGITWWNVPDGGALAEENTVNSGLLFKDLSPKPSYDRLKKLIHETWRTNTAGAADEQGNFSFRGFHGSYEVQVNGGAPATLNLREASKAEMAIQVRAHAPSEAPLIIHSS